jgi:hypothetical protein
MNDDDAAEMGRRWKAPEEQAKKDHKQKSHSGDLC